MTTVLMVGAGEQAAALEGPLSEHGYTCVRAPTPTEAIAHALDLRPDVVLLDLAAAGSDAVQALRGDFRTRFTPLMLLAETSDLSEETEELLADADDYALAPFTPRDIAARLRVLLRRPQAARALNPLSGLPGKTALMEEITFRLKARRNFAALYVDLRHFRSYNERYSFPRGDEAIKSLGEIIAGVLEAHPSPEHFAGHIGADDFLILSDRFIAQDIAEGVVARFDERAPGLYDPEDRDRGFIEITDRKGETRREPLLAVSIGITVSGPREFHTVSELEHVAAEMNAVAKNKPGSSWAIDRRRGPV